MTDDNGNDLFEKLFHAGDTIDRNKIAQILYDRVRIYPEEGAKGIIFESKTYTVKQKILLYLLVRKALTLRDVNAFKDETAAPKDIEADLEISGNSIRPVLAKLVDERLVKSGSGRYSVSNREIDRVEQEISKKDKGV